MSIFYIADLHFGHSAIIPLDRRPFKSVEEMEECRVERWNTAVCPGDTVYILGDFCRGSASEWARILRRLEGQKALIRGNHDLTQYPPEVRRELVGVWDYREVRDQGRKVILSHYPILFYRNSGSADHVMLCGHVHSTAENDWLERWKAELEQVAAEGAGYANRGQIINVGCMMPWMDYQPRTLDDILRRAAKKESRR